MSTVKKILPFIIIILLLVVIKNNVTHLFNYHKDGSELSQLEKDLQEEKKKNAYYKERLKLVATDKFVADQAQNKLGMLKEGEYFVIAPTASPDFVPIQTLNSKPNWQKWVDLFL